MAEDFLSLDAQEQGDILRTVAVRSGRPAVILEKDIWICWALQTLFSIPGLRSDYDAMRAARIVGAEAPEFDVLIEQIRGVESNANRRT